MARNVSPQFNRDDSYGRWQGGEALAEKLRVFYTSKKRMDRIASQNPMSPTAPVPGGKAELRKRLLTMYFAGKGKRLSGYDRRERFREALGPTKSVTDAAMAAAARDQRLQPT